MLVNRASRRLHGISRLKNFFGNKVLDKAYRDALSNRTVVFEDGSSYTMKGGSIPRATASVPPPPPGIAKESPPTRPLYVAIDVWSGEFTSNRVGLYIGTFPGLASWTFFPVADIDTPITGRPLGESRDGVMYGQDFGVYKEVLPNLLTSDYGTISSDDSLMSTSNVIRTPGVCPVGHPAEGEVACVGVSYFNDFSGSPAWYDADVAVFGPSSWETWSEILPIGTISGTVTNQIIRNWITNIRSINIPVAVPQGILFSEISYTFPFALDEWRFIIKDEVIDEGTSGTTYCYGATTSIDGVTVNGIAARAIESGSEKVMVFLNGQIATVESLAISSGLQSSHYNVVRQYGTQYLFTYSVRDVSGNRLARAVIGVATDDSVLTTRFDSVDTVADEYPYIDIDSTTRGYLDLSRVRLLEKVG